MYHIRILEDLYSKIENRLKCSKDPQKRVKLIFKMINLNQKIYRLYKQLRGN